MHEKQSGHPSALKLLYWKTYKGFPVYFNIADKLTESEMKTFITRALDILNRALLQTVIIKSVCYHYKPQAQVLGNQQSFQQVSVLM